MHHHTTFTICPHFAADFSAFVDGTVPRSRAGEMQAHVDNCPACLRHLAAYRRGVTALRSIGGASASPDFAVRLERRLAGESPASGRSVRRPAWFHPARLRTAALGVAAILASVFAARSPVSLDDVRMERAAIGAVRVPVVVPSEPIPVDGIADAERAPPAPRSRTAAQVGRTELDRAFERLQARLLTDVWQRPVFGDDGWLEPVRLQPQRVVPVTGAATAGDGFVAGQAVFSGL